MFSDSCNTKGRFGCGVVLLSVMPILFDGVKTLNCAIVWASQFSWVQLNSYECTFLQHCAHIEAPKFWKRNHFSNLNKLCATNLVSVKKSWDLIAIFWQIENLDINDNHGVSLAFTNLIGDKYIVTLWQCHVFFYDGSHRFTRTCQEYHSHLIAYISIRVYCIISQRKLTM